MAVIDLANPTRFLRLADRVLPWLAAATRDRLRGRAVSRR